MKIKIEKIRNLAALAILSRFFAVTVCLADSSADVQGQIDYLQQQVSMLLPLAQEESRSPDIDDEIKNQINSLDQQAENISSQWQSASSDPSDTANADAIASECDDDSSTEEDCLQQTNVADGYGDGVVGDSIVAGTGNGQSANGAVIPALINNSFSGGASINEKINSAAGGLARTEILAKITQIKQSLIQLIQQLIVELQKKLTTAR
jgi:hypothetical protein